MKFEEQLKEEMLKSMEKMFSGQIDPLLLEAINFFFPGLNFALILKFIPEQAEDIYWIMIDSKNIAILEIPRQIKKMSNVIIEFIELDEYKQQATSKDSRRRLNAAIGLMKEKM